MNKMFSQYYLVGKSECHFVIDDCCIQIQLTMGDATSGLLALGIIGEQVEQDTESNKVGNTPPGYARAHQHLSLCS